MKKGLFLVLVFVLIGTNAIFAQAVNYDTAVRNIVTQIVRSIDDNEIIAIVGFDSSSEQFSGRIIDDITRDLINDGVGIVERQRLDAILQEQNIQVSGNVSEESMQSIGRILGASSIIIGHGENMVDHYRINFRVLSVETAQIKRQIAQDVAYNANMRRLLAGNTDSDIMGNTRFYIGGMLGFGIGLHSISDEAYVDSIFNPKEKSGLGFPFSLFIGYQITDHIAIQSGLNFIFNNNIEISGPLWYQDISLHTLDIPILGRYTMLFSPVTLDAIAGFHLSFPMGKINLEYSDIFGGKGAESVSTTNVTFGMDLGLNVGKKIGPGNIVGGISFVFDFNPIKADLPITYNWIDWTKEERKVVTRRSLNIMVGYVYRL